MKQKEPKNPVYARILMLKSHLNLGQNEFCQAAKISTATYQSIRNNDPNVRSRTITNICTSLNANPQWVFKGEGDMLLPAVAPSQTNTLLEKALAKLEEQLEKQNAQVEKLTNIIMNLVGPGGGKAVNFLSVFNKAGLFDQDRRLKIAG